MAKSDEPTFLSSLWGVYLLAVLVGRLPRLGLEAAGFSKDQAQLTFVLAGILMLVAARQTVQFFLRDGRSVRHYGFLARVWGFILTTYVVTLGAFVLTSGIASLFVVMREIWGFNPFAAAYTFDQIRDYLLASGLGDAAELFGMGRDSVALNPDVSLPMRLFLFAFKQFLGFGLTGTILLVGYLLIIKWLTDSVSRGRSQAAN